jgi:hypothetical protein
MNKLGILATLQARTGKEADVEQFLSSATPLVAHAQNDHLSIEMPTQKQFLHPL